MRNFTENNKSTFQSFSVAMLSARFYPYQGGAEIQCLRLSVKLAQLGHKVLILTQKMPKTGSFDLIEGLPVFRLGLPIANRIGSFTYFLSALKAILKRFSDLDLLHAHIASTPAIIAAIVTKLTGKPSLVKFAGSRATGDVSTSLKTLHGSLKLKFIKNYATAIVCPSSEIANELEQYGFNKTRINVIANGVDTVIYSPSVAAEKNQLKYVLGLPKESKLVIYSGRLVKGKGLEMLVDCWKQIALANEQLSPCLLISGSGPLAESLKKDCSEIPSIIFLGWKDNIVDYLKACDIYILPSSGEGMPNSLMEAMSCGLACIGTDIGGIRDLIADRQNGLLFKPADAASLIKALQTFLADQPLAEACGTKARQLIVDKYSIERTAALYVELYKKLITNTSAKV